MLASFALILLVGLAMAEGARRLKLPRIIGLLAAGILLGPYVLNWLDGSILAVSAELRKMALVIILLKAGLSLDWEDLKKVGRPAVLMAFVPASFEIIGYVLLAPAVFGISRVETAVMGAVMGAVSPAVVVPRMAELMEKKRGTDKGIPQMIMAGASCDDIFVIVLFTSFLSMAQGGTAKVSDFVKIPVSIVLGILLGAAAGWLLSRMFARFGTGDTMRGILVLGTAFLLTAAEDWVKGFVPVSGLIAVVSMAFFVRRKSEKKVTRRLSGQFGALWQGAEAMLFVLVGAAVDIRYMASAGAAAAGMIFLALGFRLVGVLLCVAKTNLSWKERIYCVFAYLPKATVQAAIGSAPLAAGLPCGKLVLSVAVLAIVITAPLGAALMDVSAPRLLRQEKE